MKTTTQTPERKEEMRLGDELTLVHAYSRAEAIADGVLVAVAEETSREAGIKVPVALTQAVHEAYVKVPPGVRWQDEAGRLFDILWMTRHAIQADRRGQDEVSVELYVQNDNDATRPVKLKACLGPGDSGECVMTIMMPHES